MRDEILESLEWFEVMQCPEAFNCIYVWRNKVNGKTYVGKAEKLHKRRYKHLRAKDDYHFHRSLRKRGADGYQLAIIVKDVPTEELGDIEIYYIDVLDSLSKNGKGYNDAIGGNGGNNYAGKTEDEMREISKKQSEARKGKKDSEETKRKKSEAMKGENSHRCRKVICITNGEIFDYIKQVSEKYGVDCRNISDCCLGKRKSAEVIDGKPAMWMYYSDYEKLSEEEIARIKNEEVPNGSRPKAIICITTGKIYESIQEAERQTGVAHSTIIGCCKGKLKTAGLIDGKPVIWTYLEDYKKMSEEEIAKIKNEEVLNGTRPKSVICTTTGKIYESLTEASRQTGVERSNISFCCHGKRKSAGKDENGNKLIWKYLDEYLESK